MNAVEHDKINAKYNDGILRIEIPKKEEAKLKPVKQIKVG
ncbi:MAG TPA: Hsp20 family protein [Bacteroidales bacterium]